MTDGRLCQRHVVRTHVRSYTYYYGSWIAETVGETADKSLDRRSRGAVTAGRYKQKILASNKVFTSHHTIELTLLILPLDHRIKEYSINMGASVSTYLLGFHTLLECVAGGMIFQSGTAPPSADAIEALKTGGRDKLWKRWHATGLLSAAYVGYLGLSQPETFKTPAVQTCTIFHSLATVAAVLAYKEYVIDFNQAVSQNLHLYLALGFGAVAFGLVD